MNQDSNITLDIVATDATFLFEVSLSFFWKFHTQDANTVWALFLFFKQVLFSKGKAMFVKKIANGPRQAAQLLQHVVKPDAFESARIMGWARKMCINFSDPSSRH